MINMKEIHLMCIILEFLWLFKETKWCFVSVIMMKTGLNFNFQSKILTSAQAIVIVQNATPQFVF